MGVLESVVDENGAEVEKTESIPATTPSARPASVVTDEMPADLTPESWEALNNLPAPRTNPEDTANDRFKAAVYSVANGFGTGVLQQIPARYVNAKIKSIADGSDYKTALQELYDEEQELIRQYPKQTATLEAAGNAAGTALSSLVPGLGVIARSYSGLGNLGLSSLARKYGVIAAEGAYSGYLNAPLKEGELQSPMTSAASGAVLAPVATAITTQGARAIGWLAGRSKSLVDWYISTRATNAQDRKAITDALDRYSSRVVMDGNDPKFAVEEVTPQGVGEIASDILKGFNRAAATVGEAESDIIRMTSELKQYSHNASLLKDTVKEKLSSIDIPEETVSQTRKNLDALKDRISQESARGIDALGDDKVTLKDFMRSFVSAESGLKGAKGYMILGEKDAGKQLRNLFIDISSKWKTKNKEGKIVWKQDPSTIKIDATEVKDIIKTIDRTLDGWYEQSSGQYKGDLSAGVDLKAAFSSLRRELSDNLKSNPDYKAAMKRASDLQEVRKGMLDVLNWRTDADRPVYERLRYLGESMMTEEQSKIRAFGQMATGFDLEAEMLRFKSAKEALKNVDSMFDWNTGRLNIADMSEADEALNRISRIKDLLPSEYGKTADILNEMVMREQLISQRADDIYQYVSKNKNLFKKSVLPAVERSEVAGKIPFAPKTFVGGENDVNNLINKIKNPRANQITIEEERAIRSLEESGLTDSKDILERLMDARAANTLNKSFIRGSRGVVTGGGIGQAVGGVIGGRKAATIGEGVGKGLARIAEDFGPDISRRLYRMYLTKQMKWSRGIAKTPGAVALSLSNSALHQINISKEDPEYQSFMRQIFDDKSIPADKKIELANRFKNGVQIDVE